MRYYNVAYKQYGPLNRQISRSNQSMPDSKNRTSKKNQKYGKKTDSLTLKVPSNEILKNTDYKNQFRN